MKLKVSLGLLLVGTLCVDGQAQCNSGPPRWLGPGDQVSPEARAAGNQPKPGGPATPAPASPGTPRPNQPGAMTPGGRAGQPVGTPRSAPRRGMALTFERQVTSKRRLEVAWIHPVPPTAAEGKTRAAGALVRSDALSQLWANDSKPLLVLRECGQCQRSDEALIDRALVNDRTLLLTHWFRCVRLPAHVASTDHAFHRVFEGWDVMPHAFLLAHPDATPVALGIEQGQSSVWDAMYSCLTERYSKDPKRAVKEWLGLLDHLDHLDSVARDLQEQLDTVRADAGPNSEKADTLKSRLERNRKDHAATLAREAEVRDLGLKPVPAAAPAIAK